MNALNHARTATSVSDVPGAVAFFHDRYRYTARVSRVIPDIPSIGSFFSGFASRTDDVRYFRFVEVTVSAPPTGHDFRAHTTRYGFLASYRLRVVSDIPGDQYTSRVLFTPYMSCLLRESYVVWVTGLTSCR